MYTRLAFLAARSRSFGRLMAWLSIGVLGIPLVSAAGAATHVNLTA
ncbi:MAG: hypothetical protein R3E89_05725 [Thiolinea sp.]